MSKRSKRSEEAEQCCNPFGGYHGFCAVFDVTEKLVKKAAERGKKISTSQKICKPCRNRLNKKIKTASTKSAGASARTSSRQQEMKDVEMAEVEVTDVDLDATIGPQTSSDSKEDTDSDSQFDPANIDVKQLRKATNKLLTLLGIGEIDRSKMRGQVYQIDKMKKLTNRLASALFPYAQPANDAEQMIHQLKEKFHDTNSRSMKTKILSVLPKDWTVAKTRKVFGETVSKRLIKQTKKLVNENGILCDATKKMASHFIHQSIIDKAQEFWRSEKVSRSCPGIREYVQFKSDGSKERIQRRLVMLNVREVLYRSTKELLRRVSSQIQLNRKNSNCSKTKIFHVH